MKLQSKLLGVIVASLIGLCPLSYAQNIEKLTRINFTDVSADHWAKDSIDKIVGMGIVSGYPDGTFRPLASVTRAEFVSMINSWMGYTEPSDQTSFKDVKESAWYYSAILIAEKEGYISGFSDGTFRPNEKVTKEQVCFIISKIMNLQELSQNIVPKDNVSSWSKVAVLSMLSNRIVHLDEKGNFYAKDPATRVFVADVISKFAVKVELKETKDNRVVDPNLGSTETSSDGVGGGGSSGALSNDQSGIPAPEIPKQETEQEKTLRLTREVAGVLEQNMNVFGTEAEKEVVSEIVENMQKYIMDQTYDYKSALSIVREKYDRLSTKEKEDLKYKIQLYTNTNSLYELKDKFFNH